MVQSGARHLRDRSGSHSPFGFICETESQRKEARAASVQPKRRNSISWLSSPQQAQVGTPDISFTDSHSPFVLCNRFARGPRYFMYLHIWRGQQFCHSSKKKSKLRPVLGTFILPQGKDSGIYRRRPTKDAELPEFSGVIIISLCLFQSYFQLVDASFLIDPCHLGLEDSVLFWVFSLCCWWWLTHCQLLSVRCHRVTSSPMLRYRWGLTSRRIQSGSQKSSCPTSPA